LSFDLQTTLSVLDACSEIQTVKMSLRFSAMIAQIEQAMSNQDNLTEEQLEEVREQLQSVWDPADEDVSVSPAEIAAKLQIPEDMARAVLAEFTLNRELGSPEAVVENFTTGDNVLRTNPLASDGNDRFMLVHPSLVLPAIRENFEQRLKGSQFWDQ